MYVARRLVRFASEDVGLADPNALLQATAAADDIHRIGMPEGALALAQATVYLAQAPKSNALYAAWKSATAAIRDGARHQVPLRLRNAPTSVMKDLGYGQGYDYAHDHTGGVACNASRSTIDSGIPGQSPSATTLQTKKGLALQRGLVSGWQQITPDRPRC